MKKKYILLICLLNFIIVMLAAVSVNAAEEHSHSLSESGGALLWQGVSNANEIVGEGNYYLTEDIVLKADLVIDSNVSLCLNGHKISMSEASGMKSVEVSENGTLNICDCSGNDSGMITSASDTSTVFNKGETNLYSGSLCRTVQDTTRIVDNTAGAVFNMYGGKIYGTTIAVKTKGVFNVYGGSISGDRGAFQIEGGETLIDGNAVVDCSGEDWATVSLYGGALNISGGTVKNSGGSTVIQLPYGESCMNISGGTITTSGKANCINAASADADICISGGTIKNNYGNVGYVSGYGGLYGWGINANAFKSLILCGNPCVDTIYLYGTEEITIPDSGLQNETPIGIFCRSYPLAFTNSTTADYSGRFICKAPNSAYILYNNSENRVVFAMKTAIDGEISITGKSNINEILTAVYTPSDENETYVYQWYCDGVAIEGETNSTYTVRPEDINKRIKIVVSGIGFYRETKTAEVTIVKTAVQYTPPTANSFEFSGTEQELVQAGECQGGVMKYSLSENGGFSEEIPKAANVGRYVVYYRAFGDAYHSDGAVGSVMARILSATPVANAAKPTTARVRRGKTLAEGVISYGEFMGVDGVTALEGSFEWVEPEKEIREDSIERMKFIPDDTNYSEVEFDVEADCFSSSQYTATTTPQYTVTFDTNGGSKIESVTANKNAWLKKPENPAREGFVFGGWFKDEELTEEYSFNSRVISDFTLYAKWNEDESYVPVDSADEECDGTASDNCPSLAFDDLNVKEWYHLDTDYVIENGLFNGVAETLFAPNGNMTRAMLVTVLYRNEGEPAVNKSISFADMDMSAYYANAVIWAQQNGIVKGISETEFAPDENITREQIAAIMHRYAQYKGYDVSAGDGIQLANYDDFGSVHQYAIIPVKYAIGSGLLKGRTERTINPREFATRAEVSAILHRFIEANI